jgi:hypothetical protein
MKTAIGSILIITIIGIHSLCAQGGPVDSGFALPYRFTDNDSNGVNDNFINTPTSLQYMYEFGFGYGYGFTDTDSNGLNDILKQYPNAAGVNPLIDSTRLQGLERVKRADLRHGETTSRTIIPNRLKEHSMYNGHCKSDSVFHYLKNSIQ